jgi:hypothetical protein
MHNLWGKRPQGHSLRTNRHSITMALSPARPMLPGAVADLRTDIIGKDTDIASVPPNIFCSTPRSLSDITMPRVRSGSLLSFRSLPHRYDFKPFEEGLRVESVGSCRLQGQSAAVARGHLPHGHSSISIPSMRTQNQLRRSDLARCERQSSDKTQPMFAPYAVDSMYAICGSEAPWATWRRPRQ